MIGSLITRVLVLIFGYVYPAYECFKTVEMNKPDIDQLRFWCQYWILVAGLTVSERIGDTFIGWIPMYGEAKLAFFIYLWFPKTKGTTYVYDSFFRPYVAKHETEIDRNLLELRARAGDMLVLYWQKVAIYGQTRIFEILQYIALQSTHRRPAQKPNVPSNRKPAAASQPQDGQPSSPSSNTTSSSEQQEDTAEEASLSGDSKVAPTAPSPLNKQKTTPSQSLVECTKSLASDEGQTMQIDSVPNENTVPTALCTGLVEAIRVTGARSSPLNKQKTAPSQSLVEHTKSLASDEGQTMQIDSVSNENTEPPALYTGLVEAVRVTRARSRRTRAASIR